MVVEGGGGRVVGHCSQGGQERGGGGVGHVEHDTMGGEGHGVQATVGGAVTVEGQVGAETPVETVAKIVRFLVM